MLGTPSLAISRRMSRQRSRNTTPELALRSALFRRGWRYRVHYRPIPSVRREVDMAFTRRRVAVFVDGCFWHGCPEHFTGTTANRAWWKAKISRNRERDSDTTRSLEELGWTVLRLWEHDSAEEMVATVEQVLADNE